MTGFTPFFIVYGSEAVLPTDLNYGSPRIRAYNESGAQTSLEDVTDQLDEACDVALLRSARYQLALRMYHGHHVRGQAFNVGDLVLRLIQSNKDHHKLSPLWDGPYAIVEVLRPGTYKMQTADNEVLTNA